MSVYPTRQLLTNIAQINSNEHLIVTYVLHRISGYSPIEACKLTFPHLSTSDKVCDFVIQFITSKRVIEVQHIAYALITELNSSEQIYITVRNNYGGY